MWQGCPSEQLPLCGIATGGVWEMKGSAISDHCILVQPHKAIAVSGGKTEFLETQSAWKSGGGGEDEAPHLPGGCEEWL